MKKLKKMTAAFILAASPLAASPAMAFSCTDNVSQEECKQAMQDYSDAAERREANKILIPIALLTLMMLSAAAADKFLPSSEKNPKAVQKAAGPKKS